MSEFISLYSYEDELDLDYQTVVVNVHSELEMKLGEHLHKTIETREVFTEHRNSQVGSSIISHLPRYWKLYNGWWGFHEIKKRYNDDR